MPFEREKHIKFLRRCLQVLPAPYASQEHNRVTLLYFVVSSLDVLGAVDVVDAEEAISWIYSLQVLPDENGCTDRCGFRGSPCLGNAYNPTCKPQARINYDQAHIAMTYTALATLRILGDDYSRVNKQAIISALGKLQREDGSFSATLEDGEYDMRFVYCAGAISEFLNDWSGFDVDKAVQFVVGSQGFDTALPSLPDLEPHGGTTYCGLAFLSLAGKLGCLPHQEELVQWLVDRQLSGFQGRPNKRVDTCYSFWVGASLKLLGHEDLIQQSFCSEYTLSCQADIGGFSKWPDTFPDVLHTYYSLAGLSLLGLYDLNSLHFGLSITTRAFVSATNH